MGEYEEMIEKINNLIVENPWHKTQWKSSRSFRECHKRIMNFLNDLLQKHLEQEEHLKAHDDLIEEIQDLIKDLQETDEELKAKDDELQKLIDALEQEDVDIWKKINLILKYFEESKDENDNNILVHKYDTFSMEYLDQYIQAVDEVISVDPLTGLVNYDVRLYIKKDIPADTVIELAKVPFDYEPRRSAPSTYLIRDRYFKEDVNHYSPIKTPNIQDGKGVMSMNTNANETGSLIIHTIDSVQANQFMYLNGSYFLPKSKVGRYDLNKTLPKTDGYKAKDDLSNTGYV